MGTGHKSEAHGRLFKMAGSEGELSDSVAMNFFETFPEYSLPSTVSKKRQSKIAG